MKTQDYKEHYKKDAELFDYFEVDKYDMDYNRRLHTFIKKFVTGKNNRILDIGSGGGWSAKELSGNGSVFLCDLSEKNLLKIKKEYNSNAAIADALELPFKSGSFDYLILSEVLEHLNDPKTAIKEMLRVAKTGGRIIITTPYNEKIRYYLCVHCNQMTPANAHLHSFTEESLSEYIDDLQYSGKEFYKFGNKLLTLSRISYLLRHFPFWFWRLKDKIATFFINKPNTIITIIKK